MAVPQEISLNLNDLIPGGSNFQKYRPIMPRQMTWVNGNNLSFTRGDTLYAVPLTEKQKLSVITTLSEINAGLNLQSGERLRSFNYAIAPSADSDELGFWIDGRIHIYSLTSKKQIGTFSLPKESANRDYCKASRSFAYTKANNLYMMKMDGEEIAITDEKDNGIVYGSSVHRDEFGIRKGTFWSPKGNLLAFYRMDETMVTDYPLVNASARVAELKNIKYPMTGMKSHHVTVGIYNPETKTTIYLKTGAPKEKYLTNIAWSPDEKSIYIAEVNRGQDTCMLKQYDALTGKHIATLFTETHPKYVEPQKPIRFLKNDPAKFIWESRRDGYNHLYLYDIRGTLLKQLTVGKWDVMDVEGFDERGDELFYISKEESPVENHIYKVNVKTGKRVKLTKEEGVHSMMLSADGKYICDVYSSQHNPGKIAVTETKPNKTYIYYAAKNPFKNITLPEISIGSLKAADGETDLYYRIVKPLNFDPDKKYPVVVYVYGGPHSQGINNGWMAHAGGWDIYMAGKGYIVFNVDNRGTSNRGIDFENVTHRRLGVVETQDQMEGVNYLKSLSYVDANRIGVYGWSFGGFMTLNLMLRHPETFKVGVAGGPVTDWKYYEVMYGERYMDTPGENTEGYKESSMVDRAGDLRGRLLLIHGDEDPVVLLQHNLMFQKAAIKAGTHPDLFIYPGHEHNMIGRDRVHLHEHITRYFDDFLK